jgi:AcrR family transcriptional regulator
VNYHFRSKGDLYVAAWRHSFDESLKAHPADGGVPADAPAEQRFRGRIRALLERMLAPDCHEFRIIGHEMANPTGLLGEAMHDAILPLRQRMFALVQELLGDDLDPVCVRMCMMSVVGQCLHLIHREWHRRVLQFEDDACPGPSPDGATIRELADHIARFSLAGLRGIAAEARAGGDRQGADQ